ncbi:hypothetical protein L2K70_16690 [Nocardioides KLBMP 9356]|uniref:RNA polymerase sigma-70 region 2 domain-containing protein n=1 Tax=Nocardioides potassii TaxID=2911371 RepID=A0ABS9HGI9_9ACTN|nr:sigma factor [Nocardioides potassii]MCF6379251.1 hypothetical protein [Nocardioides potassii]
MVGGTTTRDDARPGREQLLLLTARGDVGAFTALYDELAPKVFGLVSCLTPDRATAETVTRDAFLEVWRRAPSYDATTASASAWVISIAHRRATRSRRESPASAPASAGRAVEARLRAAGASAVEAHAVRRAWSDGLDHRSIDVQVYGGAPAAQLIADGLRTLAVAGVRR